MSVLLSDYESEKRFATLSFEAERPRLTITPVGRGPVSQGDWVHGWFRGSSRHFLAIYWTPDQMWVCDRTGPHELDPRAREETVVWRARGPIATLSVEWADGKSCTYRYVRSARQILLDDEYPEHDLPRWLAVNWRNPEATFALKLRKGGLSPAQWVEPPESFRRIA
jgi:hypothetical protein